MQFRGVSVGRRLVALVAVAALVGVVFSLLALNALLWVRSEARHLNRGQNKSIARISSELETLVALKPSPLTGRDVLDDNALAKLRLLHQDSVADWNNDLADVESANRFRADLSEAGTLFLLTDRGQALEELGAAIERRDAEEIETVLGRLLNIQIAMADSIELQIERRVGRAMFLLGVCETLALLVILVLGHRVYQGIAPRIQALVGKVRKFQEYGVNVEVFETGQDEIAVLASALNSGFQAIEQREAEQLRFLSVTAHELKTPLTIIQGYSSALLKYRNHPGLHEQAIRNIDFQVWRISRIVDELIMATRVRESPERFAPRPLNFREVVNQAREEIQRHLPDLEMDMAGPSRIPILGDQSLLTGAVNSLLICASAFSKGDAPMRLELDSMPPGVRMTVHISGPPLSREDLDKIFAPMSFSQHETGGGSRAAMGLYFTRAVVRFHGGNLQVTEGPDQSPVFTMELPA